MWWILSFSILFENLWVSAVNGQLTPVWSTLPSMPIHYRSVSAVSVCIDNIKYCSQYGKTACQGQFLPWSKQYCAKYCGFCHANGQQTPWTLIGNYSYYISSSSNDFVNASSFCQSHMSDLLAVKTNNEHAVISRLLNVANNYWVGLRAAANGDIRWTNQNTQPISNLIKAETFGVYSKGYYTYDTSESKWLIAGANETEDMNFICKKDRVTLVLPDLVTENSNITMTCKFTDDQDATMVRFRNKDGRVIVIYFNHQKHCLTDVHNPPYNWICFAASVNLILPPGLYHFDEQWSCEIVKSINHGTETLYSQKWIPIYVFIRDTVTLNMSEVTAGQPANLVCKILNNGILRNIKNIGWRKVDTPPLNWVLPVSFCPISVFTNHGFGCRRLNVTEFLLSISPNQYKQGDKWQCQIYTTAGESNFSNIVEINLKANCHVGWTNVLQTESDGSAVTGSKVALRDAILNGAELQIYIPGWEYATSTQQVSALNNSNEICAQAIFHISKDSWKTFREDAHWYFLLICTTGHIEKSIWYVGSHTKLSSIETPSESTFRQAVIWFIRSSTDLPIYCISDNGIQTCGSKQDVKDAVNHGAGIRIVNMGSSLMNAVTELRGEIWGEYLWGARTEKRGDHEAFHNDPYWWITLYSTEGLVFKTQWNNNGSLNAKHTSMKWLADRCWTLAYQHDEHGNSLDGSLEFLKSAVKDGHRLKIVLVAEVMISADANNIVLRLSDVSAQMSFLHEENSVSWFQVSTSGNGDTSMIDYNRDGTAYISSSNGTLHAYWYIDSRRWKHMLTTSEIGIATFGSKSALIQYIRRGLMLRCVIHFSADHILSAQADNVEISPDGTNIGAQLLRIISYTTEGTSSRQFEKVPYWRFTIVSTEGTINQSEWMIGNHTLGITNSTSARIDWFVN